jgi:diguanylate cyclase (GGDEF)-like protein
MGREEAFLISEKIRKSIGKKYKDHEKKICKNISASFGIAVFPNDGNNVDHLINKADGAMYKVKISGQYN